MMFSMTGMNTVLAAEGAQTISVSGLCDHHTEHNQKICGYTEGMPEMPCTHEHTDGCYKEVTDCAHTHTDACYEAEVPTAIDSDEAEPVSCTHICDEESGCVTKVLDCPHERGEHDADCGYAPAMDSVPCGFVCEDCAKDSGTAANSLPFAPFDLTRTEGVPTEIWVNSADILQDSDKTIECGSGMAVYEESSHTLTLNNAAITACEGREGAGIYANGDLRIVLNGSSSINGDAVAVGVKADGTLDISGSGSLAVDTEYLAFKSVGDMTISEGTITATSANSNSFWANEGTITISGGDITATTAGNSPAIWADKDLMITGGKINATSFGSNGMGASGSLSISGAATDVTAKGYYPGLFTADGISISGGKVNATGTDDSGIFTRGTLSISGTADVTATGEVYCGLQANDVITISGGKVNATSPYDSAIYSPVGITVTGSPEITAEGYFRALQAGYDATGDITISGGNITATSTNDSAIMAATSISISGTPTIIATGNGVGDGHGMALQSASLDISGGIIDAVSANESAITATTQLSITGDAEVTANGKVCALLTACEMLLSAKNIEAYSESNYAVFNVTKDKDIVIDGKLKAESQNAYAIRSYGNIITDSNADISATGGWGGMQGDGDITLSGSKIEAIGNGDDGIYSMGSISIDGGSVHAKSAAGYAAIRAKSVQTSDEAATSKIALNNLLEKNGGKVAFIDWFDSGSESKSFTTFISKEDPALDTSMSNALTEVWLAVPYTVIFDVNGGAGNNVTEKVYPANKVAKPTDPTKDGSIFSGWYNGGAAFDFENTVITENITLTANWHTHTYGTDWKSDSTNHWHECTADDGAKDDVTSHTAGDWIVDKAATETEKGSQHKECTVCKYVMETEEIPVLPPQHTHTYGTDWKSDSTNHWYECTANDGAKSEEAAHTAGDWMIDKAATETEKGSRHKECTVCKYVMLTEEIPVVPPQHTHTPSAEWKTDANHHWHECTAGDGEKMELAAHTPGAAANYEHGQVCTVCGYEIALKLPSKEVIVNDKTGWTAEYEDGSVFGTEIELVVTPKTAEEMKQYQNNVDKVAKGLTLAGLYDVKLIQDGKAIQPDGKVKVSLPLTDEMKAMTDLQVVYIDDNGSVTIIPSQIVDGKIIFITDYFSFYGVIGKVKSIPAEPTAPQEPGQDIAQTGDSSNMFLWIVLLFVSGGVLTATVVIVKKKRRFE